VNLLKKDLIYNPQGNAAAARHNAQLRNNRDARLSIGGGSHSMQQIRGMTTVSSTLSANPLHSTLSMNPLHSTTALRIPVLRSTCSPHTTPLPQTCSLHTKPRHNSPQISTQIRTFAHSVRTNKHGKRIRPTEYTEFENTGFHWKARRLLHEKNQRQMQIDQAKDTLLLCYERARERTIKSKTQNKRGNSK
jgi:hypothetical protein